MNITDLQAEIRSLCDADSTSYTDAVLLRRVNSALETVVGKAINADGKWQFDDTNYTTLPIGTVNMAEATQNVQFTEEFLEVEKVKLLTADGIWQTLKAIDPRDFNMPFEEYFQDTGLPTHYDKIGDSIRLFPAPVAADVTLTNGLKVHFKRTANIFTSAEVTTGTKEPGIASPFHQLLAYMSAIPYCISYKKDRVALFEKKVDEMTKDCLNFYSHREGDVKDKITIKSKSFR